MSNSYFDPPLFINGGTPVQVDITLTPYFYNDGGQPTYVAQVPPGATLLPVASGDPGYSRGFEAAVTGTLGTSDSQWGLETELGLAGDAIRYEPMWATREAAAAFGVTLVEPGQAVEVTNPHPVVEQIPYEYGVFAGHWSPYQNTGNTLLSVVCTDLEHHDFPHVFASTDAEFPLVISVGRYWPKRGRIHLADLWVPRGHALYIPPMPALLGAECIDLHNNRNSARACWGQIARNSIHTHTLLQTSQTWQTYTYWYWNPLQTVHESLPLESRP